MLGLDRRRQTLKGLMERLDSLRSRIPDWARGFHDVANRLRERIQERLRSLVLIPRAEETQALQQACAELEALAEGVLELHREATGHSARETQLADGFARLADRDLRDWLAARSRLRAEIYASAGPGESQTTAIEGTRACMERAVKEQRFDRVLFENIDNALRCLGATHSPERTEALAKGFPELRRRLLSEGPSADWIRSLRDLMEPLQRLRSRPKPLAIDDIHALIQHLDEWVGALRDQDGSPLPSGQGRTRGMTSEAGALNALSIRYNNLSEHWQDYEDREFDTLLQEARALELRLESLAAEEHARLLADLELNLRLFHHFADPDLFPGLAEEVARLLQGVPKGPEELRRWRDLSRSATDRFRAALGADAHEIERLCETKDRKIRERLDGLASLPLDSSDRVAAEAFKRQLDSFAQLRASDPQVRELLAALDRLGDLEVLTGRLDERANRRHASLVRRRRYLGRYRDRLRSLAQALGESEDLAAAVATLDSSALPEDRTAAGRQLIDERRMLRQASEGPLHRCQSRLRDRLSALHTLSSLIDQDLRPELPDGPPLTTPRLPELESLAKALPALDSQAQDALGAQIERLLVTRTELLEALGGIDHLSLSAADRDGVARLTCALHECEDTPDQDPSALADRLRRLTAPGGRLLKRIRGQEQRLEEETQRLRQRLADVQDGLAEVDGRTLVDRVRDLIREVPGVGFPQAMRAQQIEEAGRILSCFERFAHRTAAARFARSLEQIERSDAPEARRLVQTLGDDRRRLPDCDARLEVRDLALALARRSPLGAPK